MPHEKFGKVGFFLGGGGTKEGLPQAIQLKLFFESGIKPDVIDAGSVGAFNALDPENSLSVWESYLTSPEAIYAFNPAIEKMAAYVIEALPHKPHIPHFPIKTPKHWTEFVEDFKKYVKDCKIQIYKLVSAYTLITPLLQPSFYQNSASIKKAQKAGEPLLREISKFIEKEEMRKIPAFLDIEPLIKLIFEKINLESAFNKPWEINFLVRLFKTGGISFLRAGNPQELIQLARASSAIRPLFPPVFVQEEWYCDGVQTNPFPVENLFDKGCNTIFAFIKNYDLFAPQDDIFKALFFEEADGKDKQFFHTLKEKAQKRAKEENKKLFIIHPTEPAHPDLGLLSISPEAIKYTKEKETEATMKFIERLT